ncbi:MAG: fructose-6-phosphate aldolase [Candidatus Lokiarchaeota archaeon]|nr:fructose-6-phosphate aldolase [Candidatus Lokiarchaeota archaeon]MBD3201324.1 fructose-6-phosphate aldolase [Candidatus Lokiarchaeota archaeon]
MKFFIDTANIDQIREMQELGIIDGVTTNPSLLSKEGAEPIEQLEKICEIVDGPISAEVVGLTTEEMVKEARDLSKIAPNIVIKIPMTKDGIKAVKILEKEGIKTNVTLVFSQNQVLIAAKAGASYISPFIGRLMDNGQNEIDMLRESMEIINAYGFKSEIIVASIRNARHVIEAARIGSHIATIPFAVLEKMFKHPRTDEGLDAFLKDWEKLQDKLKNQ